MSLASLKNLLFFSICIGILLSLVLYLPTQNNKGFFSPDENSNYLATKLYADTNHLWYVEEYTELDIENYLHPRHFVTLNERVVFAQFFGLPILYGTFYPIIGEKPPFHLK